MPRLVGRSAAIVLGICLTAAGLGAGLAALPPAAAAAEEDVSTWQKLWHPAFKPRMGARTSQVGAQRVGERFAIVGGDDRGAVVWWSDDGLKWRRSPSSDATERGEGVSIAGEPGRYVMGGHEWTPTPRGRLWHSADGREWVASSTKLPRDSSIFSLAALDDGRFAVYGYEGGNGGCGMGTSADGGVTWDFRWEGDWDPGQPGGCATSVVNDKSGLLARINLGGISESTDGITWRELVSEKEIRQARPKGARRYVDAGLVPLGDGHFVVGGKGARTLVWSREGGLERVDGPVDWSGLGRIQPAFGPDRAVAVKRGTPAPLVSPPADVHTQPWETRGPVCRRFQPKIHHLTTMLQSERIGCHGGRELTFQAWIPFREYGGWCPFGAPHRWMICEDYWLASGPGPSPGSMNYGLAPNAKLDKGVQSWGERVRVTGHFDDPAAARCPEPDWNGKVPQGWKPMTRTDFVEQCRQMFIVTEMRRIKD